MGGKAAKHDDFGARMDVIAEDLFTDRTEPRKAFWDIYNGLEKDCYEVLCYYGVGGIGKTTLLKQLAKEMDEDKKKRADHLFFSFENRSSKEDFLFTVSRMLILSHKGLKCPLFDAAFTKMLLEEGKNISMYEDQMKEKLTNNPVIDGLLSAAGDFLPGIGGAAKLLEEAILFVGGKINDAEKKNSDNAALYEMIERSDNTTIRKDLHRYLARDVEEVLTERTRPFVFFIDGYENYVDIRSQGLVDPELEVDYWLKNQRNGFVLLPNTIWVVAGREQLHWPAEVLEPENMHRIGNLSEIDAEVFLHLAGIDDQNLIPVLYRLTDGMPAFMDLCVDTYRSILREQRKPTVQDFGRNTDELARRYLDKMPEDMRNVILMLSVFPNVWNRAFAEEIARAVGYESYIPALDKVLKLSLIDKVAKGYRLHETIRKIVKNYVSAEMQDRIEEAIVGRNKQQLLALDEKEYREEAVRDFVESLENQADMELSEEEIIRIADIIDSETKMTAKYEWGYEALSRLVTFTAEGDRKSAHLHCRNRRTYYLYKMKRYDDLMAEAKENYDYGVQNFGKENRYTLGAISNLATAYYVVNKKAESLKLDEECYHIAMEILGEEDTVTLSAMNSLAVSYGAVNRQEERISLLEQCYAIRSRVLGPDHYDTLLTLSNLGNAYEKVGNLAKAKEIQVLCLQSRQRVLGASHPETARSERMLAQVKNGIITTNKMDAVNLKSSKSSRFNDAFGNKASGVMGWKNTKK